MTQFYRKTSEKTLENGVSLAQFCSKTTEMNQTQNGRFKGMKVDGPFKNFSTGTSPFYSKRLCSIKSLSRPVLFKIPSRFRPFTLIHKLCNIDCSISVIWAVRFILSGPYTLDLTQKCHL